MIKYKVTLTEEEREELNTIVNKGKHPATRVKNAQILLNCDESQGSKKFTNEVISSIVRVSMKTIDRVKKKFVEEGFEAVLYPGKTKRV